MEIHIGINCFNKKSFESTLEKASSIFPDKTWLHIDVSDGIYTDVKSFVDEKILKKFSNKFLFEAHLMIEERSLYDNKWFSGLYNRILVQSDIVNSWEKIEKVAQKSKTELGIIVSTRGMSVEIPKKIKTIGVLAVSPGPSGQKFNRDSLYVIEHFKKTYPYATILVDGGVNLNTGRLSAKAGADVLVSTSYIWKAKNPYDAYKTLSFL